MKLHNKFAKWMDKWREENVAGSQVTQCRDWLMGRVENLKACKTVCLNNNSLDRAPYYHYNKYEVEYEEPPRPMVPVTTNNNTVAPPTLQLPNAD